MQIDVYLSHAKGTAALPNWWVVGPHDKALLEGFAKYGVSRHDLIVADPTLPFYAIHKETAKESEETEDVDMNPDGVPETPRRSSRQTRSNSIMNGVTGGEDDNLPSTVGIELHGTFGWPSDMVIQRRFDMLLEIMSNPSKFGLDENTTTRPTNRSAENGGVAPSKRSAAEIDDVPGNADKKQRVAVNQTSITSFFATKEKTGQDDTTP